MAVGVQLQLDDAWPDERQGLPTVHAEEWGPQLRFTAPPRAVCRFARSVAVDLPPFVLLGSGDFHHLTRVLVRRFTRARPVAVVVFDNHPDWDVRPPEWSCGGWTARTAHDPGVASVHVWGCANFELRLPWRLFADRRALADERLVVHPWGAGRLDRLEETIAGLTADAVYVSVDLDCLRPAEAVTNWENGRFSAAEVAHAVRVIRRHRPVVGGDVCGAWSPPRYARRTQRLAARFDHPRRRGPDEASAREVNERALATIWPALVDEAQRRAA